MIYTEYYCDQFQQFINKFMNYLTNDTFDHNLFFMGSKMLNYQIET